MTRRSTHNAQRAIIAAKKNRKRSPRNKEELELWFEGYASTEKGKQLLKRVAAIVALGMTDAEAAHQHRLRKAERILRLFEEANRRPARTMEELNAWAASPEGKQWLALDN